MMVRRRKTKVRRGKSKRRKLPKNAKVGSVHTITVRGRRVKFKRVKKSGFGCWRITK